MRVLLSIFLVLVQACSASSAAVRPVADDELRALFPLEVGNSWTYETRFGERVEQNTVRIEEREGASFRDSRGSRFAFDEEGLRDQRRYLLRAPLEVGTSWKSTLDVGKVETFEIVATGQTISVPAGSFSDAVIVRGRTTMDPTTELEIDWTYAPHVGLVRVATTAILAGDKRVPQTQIELRSFELR